VEETLLPLVKQDRLLDKGFGHGWPKRLCRGWPRRPVFVVARVDTERQCSLVSLQILNQSPEKLYTFN
jgi:hypothetical protein